MRIFYCMRFFTVMVAASYMTLIIFSKSEATNLIFPYGVLVLVLAAINLWGEYHGK